MIIAKSANRVRWHLLLLVFILLLPVRCMSSFTAGAAVRLTVNAGTLERPALGGMPGLWMKALDVNNSGWILDVNYMSSEVQGSGRLRSISRTAGWLMRSAEVRIKETAIQASGGIGWGLWKYKGLTLSSLRGTIGFRSEIESEVNSMKMPGLGWGIGYEGLNIPGTGAYDDVFFIQIRYKLLSVE